MITNFYVRTAQSEERLYVPTFPHRDFSCADRGGPIVPRFDCPHISKHVKVSSDLLDFGEPCSHYKTEGLGTTGSGGAKYLTDDGGNNCPPRGELDLLGMRGHELRI